MPWHDIQFRLLQAVVNPIGDERRTVALVHWDGLRIRFARATKPTLRALGSSEDDVRDVLRALELDLRPLMVEKDRSGVGLDKVYEVSEGRGSFLMWSSLRFGRTSNPTAHFEEFVRLLGLESVSTSRRSSETTSRRRSISNELVYFGERIRGEIRDADRVRTHHLVRGLRQYESPLSWMNGRWHHSFPMNFKEASAGSVVDRLARGLGRIDLSIPREAVGVILAVFPESPVLRGEVEGVEGALVEQMAGRVELVKLPMVDGFVSFSALEERVLRDVRG